MLQIALHTNPVFFMATQKQRDNVDSNLWTFSYGYCTNIHMHLLYTWLWLATIFSKLINKHFKDLKWMKIINAICETVIIIPVWIPIRSRSWSLGLCLILKVLTCSSKANDMLATSRACSFPFLTGRPETTMYASPIVSTCKN